MFFLICCLLSRQREEEEAENLLEKEKGDEGTLITFMKHMEYVISTRNKKNPSFHTKKNIVWWGECDVRHTSF